MKSSTIAVWLVIIVLLIAGGWYFLSRSVGSYSASNNQPAGALGVQGSEGQTNTGQTEVAPAVTVASSASLGKYLVAENGMTLYLYTKDTNNVSNCTGTCAVNWPPYLRASAEPLIAGENATGTLATITRADGTGEQLTYNGIPLYFWKNDTKPGDTTGQNVGGVWFVVKP